MRVVSDSFVFFFYLFIYMFVRLLVYLIVCLFVRSFVCPFVRPFVSSCVRSIIRSFVSRVWCMAGAGGMRLGVSAAPGFSQVRRAKLSCQLLPGSRPALVALSRALAQALSAPI